jgi:hypothetical protein
MALLYTEANGETYQSERRPYANHCPKEDQNLCEFKMHCFWVRAELFSIVPWTNSKHNSEG